jgi:hypothetical protein
MPTIDGARWRASEVVAGHASSARMSLRHGVEERSMPSMHMRSQWQVLRLAGMKWWNDNALRLSASLSYYTLFSLAPMLIIVIAVAGLLFGQEAVEGRLMEEIQGLVGVESALAIQSMIQHARKPSANATATGISLIAMVVLSTGVFVELQDALNLIWRVAPRESSAAAFWRILKGRLFSFCLVLGIGFLLIVSLALSAAVAAIGRFFAALLPGRIARLVYRALWNDVQDPARHFHCLAACVDGSLSHRGALHHRQGRYRAVSRKNRCGIGLWSGLFPRGHSPLGLLFRHDPLLWR